MMETVKIGWSRREISMEGPLSIPGQMYLRISQGVHDPLYVTALCIDGGAGQDPVIFCTCDVVLLRGGVIQMILDKVEKLRPEIPRDAMILGATHTHTSGSLIDTPEKSPDGVAIYPGSAYREFFTDQAAAAICQAWDTRKSGGIAYGYGYAVVGHSRRTIFHDDVSLRNPTSLSSIASPNGHGVMYGNTNHPEFSHYEAGADHFLNAMFTFDGEKKLTGIVINVPCPSQVGGGLCVLSADYWNEVRQMVAQEFGEDVYVLPQCAPAGDQAPRILHYKDAQKRRLRLKYGLDYEKEETDSSRLAQIMSERYDIAERILDGVREVYSWAKKEILTALPVRHVKKDIQLSRRMITEEEKRRCEENLVRLQDMLPDPNAMTAEEYRVAISRYETTQNRNQRALDRHATQQENPKLDTVIHAVQIGDIAFATSRFELYIDYMHRIQARSPFMQTFCIQLAGDEGATYLPTARGIENRGYSASMLCNQVGCEGGQELVEETLTALNTLYAGSPDSIG